MFRSIAVAALLCCACLAQAAEANPQVVHLPGYDFQLYANAPLDGPPQPVEHAVVLVHGIRRNAADYFDSGQQLLGNAGLTARNTLLLAPRFLTDEDPDQPPGIPRWAANQWLHGSPSYSGVAAFKVLDDLLGYLANRQQFPALKDIVLVGHSAGAQLVQRYAVFNPSDALLAARGIHLRYGVASPSSYLYFDTQRWHDQQLGSHPQLGCPGYNRYRYGLEKLPAYATEQAHSGKQLFRRYAARDVVYLVGAKDDNPEARVMDRSCSAQLQGATRRQRQLQYATYEQRLAQQWQTQVAHPQVEIEGVGHNPAALLTAPQTAKALFKP